MLNDTCPICGKLAKTVTYKVPSFTKNSKYYSYLYFSCCDFFVQKPRISMKKLNELYNNEYHVFAQNGLFYEFYKLSLLLKAFSFRRIIKNKKILEIGSGTGEFLHSCLRYKPKSVSGIEISSFASRIAHEKFGVKSVNIPLESYTSSIKYDTIFMFHVIEHFEDPKAMLLKCKSLLRQDGTLIIETPNSKSYERKFYGIHWPNWSAPFHLQIYSPQSLAKLLESSGFSNILIFGNKISNTYSFLIPYLARNGIDLLIIILLLQFMLNSIISSFQNKSGIMTLVCKRQ